jgi:hypothetical protein
VLSEADGVAGAAVAALGCGCAMPCIFAVMAYTEFMCMIA